jgi:hypothetical protein
MRAAACILLIIALTSCSTFNRMKYRHLQKVPATAQSFTLTEKPKAEHSDTAGAAEVTVQAEQEMQFEVYDSTVAAHVECSEATAAVLTLSNRAATVQQPVSEKKAVRTVLIKRDWSLLVGLLLIGGGMMALVMCFYLPFSGMSFLLMLALEIFFLYFAWRAISTGVGYFVTRFRSRKNYREE